MILSFFLGLLFLLLKAPHGSSQLFCPVPPLNCPSQYVNFYLYNSSSANSPFKITESNAASAPIAAGSKLVILLHGWTGNKDYSPNLEIRKPLLDAGYQVISVDYSSLATFLCYIQGVVNVNLVGLCTSRIISRLVAAGRVNLQDVHVLGFSLGAHAAGATGKYFRQTGTTLPWVTGLDPAGPLFSDLFTTTDNRLDPSDAGFVDVIHTNAFIEGKPSPSGAVDFYVNGGTFQPGCEISNSVTCNHDRAPVLYAESVTTTVGFIGRPCNYNGKIINDVCIFNGQNGKAVMGLKVDKSARGTYRVETNSSPPYARG